MAARKVSKKKETTKILSLYVARLGIWDNRQIHHKDREKRKVLPFSGRDVKNYLH
jgi:hypothetical protein